MVPHERDGFRERLYGIRLGWLGKVEEWEVHIQPQAGNPFPAALTVAAEGIVSPTASLRWMIRDVTERKRLEHERTTWLLHRVRDKAAQREKEREERPS